MDIKYQIAGKCTKWPLNIPTSSIQRPSKSYQKIENVSSGNPGINERDGFGLKICLLYTYKSNEYNLKSS
jgi:hypothetical protein